MKKVIYLLAMPLIFMYSCSKDEPIAIDSSPEAAKLEMLSIDSDSFFSRKSNITQEELQERANAANSSKSSNSHANGHFTTQQGNTITFSSGKDGEYGDFNIRGAVNFKGDVICATVEGNRAVIQVVVTDLGAVPDGFPNLVGWTFLYLFEDNGEGNNAPSDRYFSLNLNAPFDFGACIEMTPSFLLWINDDCGCGGAWLDTYKSSDQIQIK